MTRATTECSGPSEAETKGIDMGDMGDDFRAMRAHRQDMNRKRLESGTKNIEAVKAAGYSVDEKTSYQFRVENRLDLFPTNRRYHDIKKNERGHYDSALKIVQKIVGSPTS